MGCAGSKQTRCRHCKTASNSPMARRSFSMNVHHPPEKKGDSYHMVALTSSTIGSIMLDSPQIEFNFAAKRWGEFDDEIDNEKQSNHEVGIEKEKEFAMGMIQAKAWSKMIDEKITRVAPKTPIRTPPGEPETIYVRDLMEGLEDDNASPLRVGGEHHHRSFSFHVSADSIPPLIDSPRAGGFHENQENKPWFDSHYEDEKDDDHFVCSNDEKLMISKAIVSEFDPEVISAFRKALEELSPTNPFHLKPRDDNDNDNAQVMKNDNGINVEEKSSKVMSSNGFVADSDYNVHVNGFVERMIAEEKDDDIDECAQSTEEDDCGDSPSIKERVILYFTSLRGVRTTYEHCCYVRLVLKGLGVRVDERDVSMHSGFKQELKDLLGEEGFKGGLPKVFIGERYIGGVDEIRKLHEDGKLEKVVEHCERMDDDGGNLVDVCEACGDIRFIPCETCSGSCKIYYEFDEEEGEGEGKEEEEDEYGFQRCPDCNENGLVRCPICCY